MPWFYEVAERDHELQNPTSPEKILLLGQRLGLGEDSVVLDVASGRGGPALLLAEEFGCRLVGVERFEGFYAAALERARARGLGERVTFHLGDATAFPIEAEAYDAALCLGAAFVWGGLEGTLAALVPAVRPGGHVAVGEAFWRSPPPPGEEEDFVSLRETALSVEQAGLALVGLIASSTDDWDRYESLHWASVEAWLAEHPEDPGAPALRNQHERERYRYLYLTRDRLGWAIFVGRKSLG